MDGLLACALHPGPAAPPSEADLRVSSPASDGGIPRLCKGGVMLLTEASPGSGVGGGPLLLLTEALGGGRVLLLTEASPGLEWGSSPASD